MASPMPVPVVSAIHDAAERCPSSRQAVDSAARLENSTLPACPSRSISANSVRSVGGLGGGDPVGVGLGQRGGDVPAGLSRSASTYATVYMRVYQ